MEDRYRPGETAGTSRVERALSSRLQPGRTSMSRVAHTPSRSAKNGRWAEGAVTASACNQAARHQRLDSSAPVVARKAAQQSLDLPSQCREARPRRRRLHMNDDIERRKCVTLAPTSEYLPESTLDSVPDDGSADLAGHCYTEPRNRAGILHCVERHVRPVPSAPSLVTSLVISPSAYTTLGRRKRSRPTRARPIRAST
jgi:hypothetical protein